MHSRVHGEALRHLRSAPLMEPPTWESPVPALDEAVSNPGLPAQWGNTLGKKERLPFGSSLKTLMGFHKMITWI